MSSSNTYIIAEIGNNHQGDVKHALELMKAAKECGADAVKTQKKIIKLYILNLFLMKNMIIQIVSVLRMVNIERN